MAMRWVVVELNCIGSRYKNTFCGQRNFFNKIGAFGCEILYNENEVVNCNLSENDSLVLLRDLLNPFRVGTLPSLPRIGHAGLFTLNPSGIGLSLSIQSVQLNYIYRFGSVVCVKPRILKGFNMNSPGCKPGVKGGNRPTPEGFNESASKAVRCVAKKYFDESSISEL